MYFSLVNTSIVSVFGGILTYTVIPKFRDMFIKAGLFGVDLNKSSGTKVPEATGVITGCIFLMITFLMIPFTYSVYLLEENQRTSFPHEEFVQLVAALLSITCMLLLGFADDVLDLRWRHKLLLPSMASLPLLMVYYVTTNRTEIVVPTLLRGMLGYSIKLGILYYVYMGLLAVFCTNAINILAGINGLEVGQSVVIAISLVVFNLMSLSGGLAHHHQFSLYFLLPYIGTSVGLLAHNWFPSSVFPGDTFCYFSGMTLAVVAILGHFSKTLLLFFLPQILNFVYSTPQLFHLVPCPRHRLPKYCKDTNKVNMSKAVFPKSDLKLLGSFLLYLFSSLRLSTVRNYQVEEDEGRVVEMVECNNLTLINFLLKLTGPLHEETLTIILLGIQVASSILAFAIRYPLAYLLFGEIVA
jgi:UDP-N-acetylglucosamine--dolichyl-phosphate N-acetylglucosaminephosphotransferase